MTSLCFRNLRSCASSLLKKCPIRRYVSHQGAYEGDGKTTVTILNKDLDYGLMVNSLSPAGFTLNIQMTVLGPMIIFPKSVIRWNISSPQEINEDSLALFKLIFPRPDIVVFGLDQRYPRNEPLISEFKKTIRSLNISLEVLPVEKACQTFNFLNAENRYVVGALLPPRVIEETDYQLLEERSVNKVMMGEPLKLWS